MNRCALNVYSVKIMDQGCLSLRSSVWREKIFSLVVDWEGKGRQEAGDSEEFGGKGKEAIHRFL